MTVGAFGLMGGFLYTGGHLDSGTGVGLAVFCTAPISAILGFYFGKTNGTQEAMAQAALSALQMAAQRRTSDIPVVTAPVTVQPPS